MEFKQPKAKKNCPDQRNPFVPLPDEQRFGVFNGLNVTIFDWDSMNDLYFSGNFGKGSLSKSAPMYHIQKDDLPKLVYQQQFENQSKWTAPDVHCQTCPIKHSSYTKQSWRVSLQSVDNFLQSSFNDKNEETWKSWKEKNNLSDEENIKHTFNENERIFCMKADLGENTSDDYLSKEVNNILDSKQGKQLNIQTPTSEEIMVVNTEHDSNTSDITLDNISSTLVKRPFLIEENLKLSLEESFFLAFVLGSLRIFDLNHKELDVPELWEKFNEAQNNFLERYVVYHYYRAKGWVVKSGLKFGGDFLLYKDGPAYYHGSYLIKVLESGQNLTWRDVIGRNRLVETFNKDLILCSVIAYSAETEKRTEFPENLKNYSVQEVLVRRWFPSKERVLKTEGT